jgi:hypothetical protein
VYGDAVAEYSMKGDLNAVYIIEERAGSEDNVSVDGGTVSIIRKASVSTYK